MTSQLVRCILILSNSVCQSHMLRSDRSVSHRSDSAPVAVCSVCTYSLYQHEFSLMQITDPLSHYMLIPGAEMRPVCVCVCVPLYGYLCENQFEVI